MKLLVATCSAKLTPDMLRAKTFWLKYTEDAKVLSAEIVSPSLYLRLTLLENVGEWTRRDGGWFLLAQHGVSFDAEELNVPDLEAVATHLPFDGKEYTLFKLDR